MNAYWENNYYYNVADNSFLNCQSPSSQQMALNDFLIGIDYNVTYFPTRMNTSLTPANQLDLSGSGTITLDLSTEPLNGVFNYHLDTLHSDYAFVISMNPIVRNAEMAALPDATDNSWDFQMYPNPTTDVINLSWVYDQLTRKIEIIDFLGHVVLTYSVTNESFLSIPINRLAHGIYAVRISDKEQSKSKPLIIQ